LLSIPWVFLPVGLWDAGGGANDTGGAGGRRCCGRLSAGVTLSSSPSFSRLEEMTGDAKPSSMS